MLIIPNFSDFSKLLQENHGVQKDFNFLSSSHTQTNKQAKKKDEHNVRKECLRKQQLL